MQELGMEESYFKGMEFYGANLNSTEKEYAQEAHFEVLQYLNSENRTFDELKDILGIEGLQLARLMGFLSQLGYIGFFKEKGVTYYSITPIGRKVLYQEIARLILE